MDTVTSDELADSRTLPPGDAEQIRRALVLLNLADKTEDFDTRFVLRAGALHLARAIPEYWYGIAQRIPIELNIEGKDRSDWAKRLHDEFEEVFLKARRYTLLTNLREWDFHWEPLLNPETIGPNCTYGRGALVRLSTGPNKNSSVTFLAGNRLIATGSGHRVGRTNYYQIQHSRFVDSERGEAVPLALAVRQFIEDLPNCVAEILEKPEVLQFIKARE